MWFQVKRGWRERERERERGQGKNEEEKREGTDRHVSNKTGDLSGIQTLSTTAFHMTIVLVVASPESRVIEGRRQGGRYLSIVPRHDAIPTESCECVECVSV